MAQTVSWVPSALQNLEQLAADLEHHSPKAAQRLTQECFRRAERLSAFPHMGQAVLVKGRQIKDYRQLLVGDYRLVYRFLPSLSQVQVLAVVHQSQDPRKILKSLPI